MGERARVESVDALKKFRAALCKFAELVTVGLDDSEADVNRTGFWIKQEQLAYWKTQGQKRAELYTRAKSALSRKKNMKTALGGRFSCVDEEKALAAAERQLEEARQKLANVQRWSRQFDEESFTYQAVAQGMRVAVESDIPNALAKLDNMIAALEAYAAPAPVEVGSEAPGIAGAGMGGLDAGESMARGIPWETADAPAYRALRSRTPSQAIRDATTLVRLDQVPRPQRELRSSAEARGTVRVVVTELGAAHAPVGREDRIVMASGAAECERVYLERVAGAPAGDSGWYLGPANDVEVGSYFATRAENLLNERPELGPILELPAGYLVVLDGPLVAAVLDPADRLVWRAAAMDLD